MDQHPGDVFSQVIARGYLREMVPLPTHDELTTLHGDATQAPLIHRLRDQLAALNLDQPGQRCPHGINVSRAGCGPCLASEGVL